MVLKVIEMEMGMAMAIEMGMGIGNGNENGPEWMDTYLFFSFEGGGDPPGRYFMRGVWGSQRRKSVRRLVGSWVALGATRKIKILSLISSVGHSRKLSFWRPVCEMLYISFIF